MTPATYVTRRPSKSAPPARAVKRTAPSVPAEVPAVPPAVTSLATPSVTASAPVNGRPGMRLTAAMTWLASDTPSAIRMVSSWVAGS